MTFPDVITYTTGSTLKTVLYDNSSGALKVWNTATPGFEAYSAGNVANYGIATSETGNPPGNFSWSLPATLAASAVGFPYIAVTYRIAGANLATGDFASPTWRTAFGWTGSATQTDGNAIVAGFAPGVFSPLDFTNAKLPAKATRFANVLWDPRLLARP